jgi:short-subunit dehydrogenase
VPRGAAGDARARLRLNHQRFVDARFSAGLDRPFLPKRATYAATRAFVNASTETLFTELAGTGVKAQALCPGVVRTEFLNVDGTPALRPNVPVMEPEDVVEASLAALALGDVICSPVLADRTLLDREHEARHAVFGAGLGATLSPRYAGGQTAAVLEAK